MQPTMPGGEPKKLEYNMDSFTQAYIKATGKKPKAGDWYYHENRRKRGAEYSIHEVQESGEPPLYLKVPTNLKDVSMKPNEEMTLTNEDIRGEDYGRREGPIYRSFVQGTGKNPNK